MAAPTPPAPATCPDCGLSNGSRSVRAIVEAAQPQKRTADNPNPPPPQFPALAGRMLPPARPRMQISMRAGCLIMLVAIGGSILLAVGGGALVGNLLGDYYVEAAALSPTETATYAGIALFMIGFAVIFFGGFLLNQRAQADRVREEGERWRTAFARWEQLHYCGHCDLVFIPGQPLKAPLAEMRSLLYDPPPSAQPAQPRGLGLEA
ncbi:MAG TPA: hypothetical protein VFS21_21880 [Roseiflexaceae bacterium]|nr:hypothetical protein [Roseiflexaceae bacterium]